MKEIDFETIARTVRDLCIEAACVLPEELQTRIRQCAAEEKSPVGQGIFGDLIDNFTLAQEKMLPICQDTGMAVVFVALGQEVHITGGLLRDAIDEGVRRGYRDGFLRKSVVRDPLRRVNTDDNTPAVVHLELVAGDEMTITVAPKGFGSENMSGMKLFTPAATRADIEDFIAAVAAKAGSNPCPPMVLGVGLGGTVEQCALLAKTALLEDPTESNPDPYYADMERCALEKINRLGIGPQGLGGTVTALSVRICTAPTHIAGLPCVVNMGCHVTRHASAKL
ncbi:MAG: fumarate hydratase [Oscillospiraceae bacterium]|nr:fumarate hydratase [Oscillospiraceae bacterium]